MKKQWCVFVPLVIYALCQLGCGADYRYYKGVVHSKAISKNVFNDSVYWIILTVDSIDKKIAVKTSAGVFYALGKGDHTEFKLSTDDLFADGNGDEHLIK